MRVQNFQSISERFALPYSFYPELSPAAALVGFLGALARIFLGSLLFAVLGVYTALAWKAIGSQFWGGVALILLVALFFLLFKALMTAISTAVTVLTPTTLRRHSELNPSL